jgi:hypothetical protein
MVCYSLSKPVAELKVKFVDFILSVSEFPEHLKTVQNRNLG